MRTYCVKHLKWGKMNRKVFIILLNYNGWKVTLDCVKSLNAITSVEKTIVIVDNKSTDNSLAELKKNQNNSIVILEAESNRGFSAGNNIGIQYALNNGADYVLLLNNDTIVQEDFLLSMVEFSEEHPECGCSSCRIYYYTEQNKIWYDGGDFNYNNGRAVHYRFNETKTNVKGINEAGFISGCCMFIPAKVIKKVGLMDEDYFLYVEDTEYSLRIKQAGYKLYWNADEFIFHKVSSSTKKLSKDVQYYEIRNRMLLCKTYLSKIQQLKVHLYNIVFYSYKVIKGVYSMESICSAYQDFRKHKFGKRMERGI